MSDGGSAIAIADLVPLAPFTTLELGGPAEHFIAIEREQDLFAALAWASARGCAVTLLGGGSNVVVADAGIAGLVIRMATRGITIVEQSATLLVRASAGERWDDIVALAVSRGVAGIECLSGIPGSVGATPIQNVGAYGQEVADVITQVRVLDRRSGAVAWMAGDACGFGYRTSVFKRAPHDHVILEVEYALRRDVAPQIVYAELSRALGNATPSSALVRETVLALRRGKSMLIDPDDENRRSVGSFFTNPVVSVAVAESVHARAPAGLTMPSWPQPDGRIKLAAAWLIEHSGTRKGERHGSVGVSANHTLALVHHGGGTTMALLELADAIAARVHTRFGISLVLEPVRLG